MGVTTNGLLFFGIDLGEDWEPLWGEDFGFEDLEEFDDFLVKETPYANGSYPETASEEERDRWWKARKGIIEATPVDHVIHCSFDYPMHAFVVRGFSFSASRGFPDEISPDSLVVPEAKIAEFKRWLEEHDFPVEEPKWFLASLWG